MVDLLIIFLLNSFICLSTVMVEINLHGVIWVKLLNKKVKPALTLLFVGDKSPLPFLEGP